MKPTSFYLALFCFLSNTTPQGQKASYPPKEGPAPSQPSAVYLGCVEIAHCARIYVCRYTKTTKVIAEVR